MKKQLVLVKIKNILDCPIWYCYSEKRIKRCFFLTRFAKFKNWHEFQIRNLQPFYFIQNRCLNHDSYAKLAINIMLRLE